MKCGVALARYPTSPQRATVHVVWITAKEVARKIAKMKLYFDRFGEFPSKSECASRWSVGSELYSKTRASCIGCER